jgi:hypothetical protein
MGGDVDIGLFVGDSAPRVSRVSRTSRSPSFLARIRSPSQGLTGYSGREEEEPAAAEPAAGTAAGRPLEPAATPPPPPSLPPTPPHGGVTVPAASSPSSIELAASAEVDAKASRLLEKRGSCMHDVI